MEATKVWEFVHPDSLYTPSIGGVQRLPNGNTLVNFGNLQWLNMGSIVTEVDSNNQIVFQLEYDNGGNLYRAQKFDWFFYTPPTPTWNCVAGLCIDPGTGMGSYTDSLQCVMICDLPLTPTWNCIAGSCIDPGSGMGSYTDSLQCVMNCNSTHITNLKDLTTGRLIKITDMLGEETPFKNNTPLFYIYEDGTVEKKIIIE